MNHDGKPSKSSTFVWATVVLTATAWHAAAPAQTVSAPLVREATEAKTSSTQDTHLLMAAAPMRVWREGEPVRVKDDLKAEAVAAPAARPTVKRVDLLLGRATNAAPKAVTLSPNVPTNFDGIGATGVLPPDPIGAVGPNHYIQMVNSAFAIYDKTGTRLAGPSQINSLWKQFGGACENQNDGDPVVRYDHLADRWLVSQFAVDDHMQCIAISRGPDPVSSGWFLYAFPTKDASGNAVTPDYPKIGVWPDGYYMSTQRGFPSEGLDVWVFERDKMLAGQPARQVQFAIAAPSIVLQPSDLTGPAPPAGTPNYFVRPVDGQRFSGNDRLEVFEFAVDWSAPANSTFKLAASIPTAAFDSVLCTNDLLGACVPQPNTAVRLETLTAWPMFRAQYRNFGTRQTLLLNHSVDATGSDIAGVRWYELRKTVSTPWKIFQQGTHSPDNVNRWMGSIAMDQAGNIALGYSVANSTTFPGLRVATRTRTTAKGKMGPEIVIVNGGGSQTNSAARWGDYGSMDVDPARPCTFWYTSLYYAQTSSAGWRTRVAEIRMPSCMP